MDKRINNTKMPSYLITVSILILLILLISVLFSACSLKEEPTETIPTSSLKHTVTPKASETGISTELTPTLRPTSTATPVQLKAEKLEFPACSPTEGVEELPLDEVYDGIIPGLFEMESFKYRTIYRYLTGEAYSGEEISLEIQGEHTGHLPVNPDYLMFDTYPIWLITQVYEQSRVRVINHHDGLKYETVVSEDGLWIRETEDEGWVEIDGGDSSRITIFPEVFSPQIGIFMLASGGSISTGIWSDRPVMQESTTINGEEVVHRCWKTQSGKLVHDVRDVFTYLADIEAHLWTDEGNTRLYRIALRGTYIGNRFLGYINEASDPEGTFELWMDLDSVNETIEITPPTSEQVDVTIAIDTHESVVSATAPLQEFPLPENAVAVESTDMFTYISEPSGAVVPREYFFFISWNTWGIMEENLWSAWDVSPTDLELTYCVDMSLIETIEFYTEELGERGWRLDDVRFQLGETRAFLFFSRDQVKVPILIAPIGDSRSTIWALIPPDDETLEIVQNNWSEISSEEMGFPGEEVTSIAFDPSGTTWIGTSDGVIAYDGRNWTAYNSENTGLSDHGINLNVNCMVVDDSGLLWIGSDGALILYDGEEWTGYTEEISPYPKYMSVVSIAADAEGRIWYSPSSLDPLLDNYDGFHFTSHEITVSGSKHIGSIAVDNDGKIWVGNISGGIYTFDGENWEIRQKDDTYHIRYINDIVIDDEGWVWVATDQGLQVFDGEEWIYLNVDNSNLPYGSLASIGIDSSDRVWFGNFGGGVASLEKDGSWRVYTPIFSDLGSYSLNALEVSPEGQIWVGVSKGVQIFDPPEPSSDGARVLPTIRESPHQDSIEIPERGWASYTYENTDWVGYSVETIFIDNQDRVWTNTGDGIVVIDSEGDLTRYSIENSPLTTRSFSSFAMDAQDQIWMGTRSGLVRLDPDGTWTTYNASNSGLSNNNVEEIKIGSNGEVLIATGGGTSGSALDGYFLEDNTWTNYIKRGDLNDPSIDIQAIDIDHLDRVWVATDFDGLMVRGIDGEWTIFSEDDLGIEDRPGWMSTLIVDRNGIAWIGVSRVGIIKLLPDGGIEIIYLEPKEEFYIYDMAFDKKGQLWVGTSYGLQVVNLDGQVNIFTPMNSDLLGKEVHSIEFDSKGHAWIGTEMGLNYVDELSDSGD